MYCTCRLYAHPLHGRALELPCTAEKVKPASPFSTKKLNSGARRRRALYEVRSQPATMTGKLMRTTLRHVATPSQVPLTQRQAASGNNGTRVR